MKRSHAGREALVIGGGPAGLMAADILSAAGLKVVVAESKPTVARKFLMAGKSGLNLTKEEALDSFTEAYEEATPSLRPMLSIFGPKQVRGWAEGLGQETFEGSSGRVFPTVMKASPLLRAWLVKLDRQGVQFNTNWRWIGGMFDFETSSGRMALTPDITVLACGGASWARLGSDGAWVSWIDTPVAPFKPANMGFHVRWSPHMERHFGSPVKNVILTAGDKSVQAECVVSERGIEGGGIYAVSRRMREGHALKFDLIPALSLNEVRHRLKRPRGKLSMSNYLRKVLRLDPVKQALMMEHGFPLPSDLAPLIKSLPLDHAGPYSTGEAISTAGGVMFAGLDEGLMIKERPGIFVAGEMLDWEAPTGGYLLTACLATGRWAGQHALRWLDCMT